MRPTGSLPARSENRSFFLSAIIPGILSHIGVSVHPGEPAFIRSGQARSQVPDLALLPLR